MKLYACEAVLWPSGNKIKAGTQLAKSNPRAWAVRSLACQQKYSAILDIFDVLRESLAMGLGAIELRKLRRTHH